MKKLLLTSLMTAACVSAFAQGKVSFGNDANHLLVFGTAANLTAAWTSMAGQAVPQANMGSFTAELWGGASAATMTLQKSVVAGQAGFDAGRLANVNVTLTGVPSGAAGTFMVRVYETAAGSFDAAASGPWLTAASDPFTTVPGSLTFNSIVSSIAPANSTWAPGTLTLTVVPEPSTMALAGLGAAALLIFRRRK